MTTLSKPAKDAKTASKLAQRAKRPVSPRPANGGAKTAPIKPTYELVHQSNGAVARVWVGDCREVLPQLDEVRAGTVDLVFADPPFNWKRAYDRWDDDMPEAEYLEFTYDWLDLCVRALRPGGSMWVNIPDDWAAEIVCYLKGRPVPTGAGLRKPPAVMHMENWCVWHYRFGQNTTERFINSKVHALYFVRAEAHEPNGLPEGADTASIRHAGRRVWNPDEVLEMSDRAAIYEDPRTQSKKDGIEPGMRVPMDVWYGQFWGRVQGNNKERRGYHDNQLPEVYLERVIRACSDKGDLVLDPFVGSGTTAVVAHELGRRFMGTEFSKDNAKSAAERIQAGPIRIGAAKGQSTAIFPHRRKSKR